MSDETVTTILEGKEASDIVEDACQPIDRTCQNDVTSEKDQEVNESIDSNEDNEKDNSNEEPNVELNDKAADSDEKIAFYEQELARLRSIITLQNTDNLQLELKLTECEQQSKQKCEELNQNFTLKLEQTLKSFKDGQNEKTSSLVMKYAQGEKKCIDLNRNIEFLKSKLDDSAKEKQRLNERFEKSKLEKEKLNGEFEKKIQEIMMLKKESVKLKETIIVAEAREKAAQSKWTLESEAHMTCKNLLREANLEVNSLKAALEKLPNSTEPSTENDENADKNSEIDVQQESQPLDSESSANSPVTSLPQKTSPSLTLNESKEAKELLKQNERNEKELYALKSQLKDMFEERSTLRDSLQCMDKERKLQESSLTKFKETLQNQKIMNKDLLTEILELRELKETLDNEMTEKTKLDQKVKLLTSELSEIQTEMKSSQEKQTELLNFTSKLTEKNINLQSENTSLNEKVKFFEADVTTKTEHFETTITETKNLSDSLNIKLSEALANVKILTDDLDNKNKQIDELTVKLSDEQDESISLKKKHQANIKDLSRQLLAMQKKMNSTTNPTNQSNQNSSKNSFASRTNSITSLNEKDNISIDSNNHHYSLNEDTHSLTESSQFPKMAHTSSHYNEVICGNDDVYVVDIDKQKIIEKIVKLQKLLAKKNEKIDFLQDHVNQLTIDLKRKTKIIQAYAMNEPELGAFTSEAYDKIKQEMSRKTGHLSNNQNANKSYIQTINFIISSESHMTMSLCLEINSKLQALLEDTLIKNITLKDSVETLGHEIARLSKENRQILIDKK